MVSYNRPDRNTTFWSDGGDWNDQGDYMRTSLNDSLFASRNHDYRET